jgi:quinol monooxygenase YgiN
MILISGEAKLHPDKRDAAIEAMNVMSAASLEESGCIDYRFWIATADPNRILIFEKWENQGAIDAHFQSPHMATFGASFGSALDGGVEITKFEIASFGPL